MILRALLRRTAESLRLSGVEVPERTAEWLWLKASGMSRRDLLMTWNDPAPAGALEAFESLAARRAAREPLQYVLGEAEFCGLSLFVDRRVLIPRPETEALAEAAWREFVRIAKKREDRGGAVLPPLILDVGTGSGAIALCLAGRLADGGPPGRIAATDASGGALEVAAENARRLGLSDRLAFFRGNFADPLPEQWGPIDLLVSNPPYIPEGDRPSLQPEVADWEPPEALYAGGDGLEAFRALFDSAVPRMSPDGAVLVEVGHGQAEEVVRLALDRWPRAQASILQDARGVPRVAALRNLSSPESGPQV